MSCTMWPTNGSNFEAAAAPTDSDRPHLHHHSHSILLARLAQHPLPDDDKSSAGVRHAEISNYMLLWALIDITLMLWILGGNTLTVLAICCSRKLRAITSNWFVFALATSDLLVGLTLPYHLAFYVGSRLGAVREWCLLRFFLIIVACAVSIWNLIAIGCDRYVAIVYPLHYVRYVTRRVALAVMAGGWLVGGAVAAVPMVWNNWPRAQECEFDEVLPVWYLVGVVTPLFSAVWLCMLALYVRIWSEAARQARQMRASIGGGVPAGWRSAGGGDRKSVQLVLLILGCFTCCWLPYFVVACAQMFSHRDTGSPTVYKATFSLAMANSGMNPMIYAWKNPALRRAFGRLLRGRHPDHGCDEDQQVWTVEAGGRKSAKEARGGESKRQRRRRLARAQQSFESSEARADAVNNDAVGQRTTEAMEAGAVVRNQLNADVPQTPAANKRQSCCELDTWQHDTHAIVWHSCRDGRHRLMDILHIDALVRTVATTTATTAVTHHHQRATHRT